LVGGGVAVYALVRVAGAMAAHVAAGEGEGEREEASVAVVVAVFADVP
jgi:hypothetical protein